MKFTDLYYECSDLTPDQLKNKVVFLDSLTGGTYEAKQVVKSDEGDQIFITFQPPPQPKPYKRYETRS